MNAKKCLILICGIPGTGKTAIGNYLNDNKGFSHFDVEQERRIPDLKNLPDKMVITWGFVPDNSLSINAIKELIKKDFKMIWFDGNRKAAKNAFMIRGTVPIEALNIQMKKIGENLKSFENLIFKRINSFNSKSEFRDYESIADEILSLCD